MIRLLWAGLGAALGVVATVAVYQYWTVPGPIDADDAGPDGSLIVEPDPDDNEPGFFAPPL